MTASSEKENNLSTWDSNIAPGQKAVEVWPLNQTELMFNIDSHPVKPVNVSVWYNKACKKCKLCSAETTDSLVFLCSYPIPTASLNLLAFNER